MDHILLYSIDLVDAVCEYIKKHKGIVVDPSDVAFEHHDIAKGKHHRGIIVTAISKSLLREKLMKEIRERIL